MICFCCVYVVCVRVVFKNIDCDYSFCESYSEDYDEGWSLTWDSNVWQLYVESNSSAFDLSYDYEPGTFTNFYMRGYYYITFDVNDTNASDWCDNNQFSINGDIKEWLWPDISGSFSNSYSPRCSEGYVRVSPHGGLDPDTFYKNFVKFGCDTWNITYMQQLIHLPTENNGLNLPDYINWEIDYFFWACDGLPCNIEDTYSYCTDDCDNSLCHGDDDQITTTLTLMPVDTMDSMESTEEGDSQTTDKSSRIIITMTSIVLMNTLFLFVFVLFLF